MFQLKMVEDATRQAELKQRSAKNSARKRSVYFKLKFSKYWKIPVHSIIKKTKACFPSLAWLRTSMSYARFPNLREMFQSDLTGKLNDGIVSLDFEPLACN